jgi:TATA-box binding protein (TBP) (component of TFIID and TFIIIB)
MEIDDILEEDLLDIFNSPETHEKNISTKSNKDTKNDYKTAIEKFQDNVEIEDYSTSMNIDNITSSSIVIDSQNIDNIGMILKELLNNKTIEITIKIK